MTEGFHARRGRLNDRTAEGQARQTPGCQTTTSLTSSSTTPLTGPAPSLSRILRGASTPAPRNCCPSPSTVHPPGQPPDPWSQILHPGALPDAFATSAASTWKKPLLSGPSPSHAKLALAEMMPPERCDEHETEQIYER